jgi:BlaI family transcriptional regulator, penicillinase repressor
MPARGREMGELQLAVMNVLWTKKRATVAEVLEALPGERSPAYTTVLTVLRNLEKRGMVKHAQVEGTRKHSYRPIVSAHDTRGDILHDVLNRLFAGSPALLIKHLLTTEGFGLDELREIRQVLDSQERAITGASAS